VNHFCDPSINFSIAAIKYLYCADESLHRRRVALNCREGNACFANGESKAVAKSEMYIRVNPGGLWQAAADEMSPALEAC